MYEPRFDLDFGYGAEGERQVDAQLRDIVAGNGRVEVKRKRRPDFLFYLEVEQDRGRTGVYRPSGLSLTTADTWVYLIANTGMSIAFAVADLRAMLVHPNTRDAAETDGDCPTRGRLFNMADLLRVYALKADPPC